MGAIRPRLKDHEFIFAGPSTARRYLERRVDVVSLERFPTREIRQWRIPDAAFGLAAGCFFPFAPCLVAPTVKRDGLGRLLPSVTECHVRLTPYKSVIQRDNEHPNIWSFDGSRECEQSILEDVVRCLGDVVFPWFERWNTLDALWDLVEKSEETADRNGRTWGFGRVESYTRHVLAGFVAIERVDEIPARSHLIAALKCSNTLKARGLSMPQEVDQAVRAALSQLSGAQQSDKQHK